MIETATVVRPSGNRTCYLRQPDVLARVRVSWMSLRRWEDAGIFPKRRQLGPNTVAWVESEVEDWCASRKIADSEQGS